VQTAAEQSEAQSSGYGSCELARSRRTPRRRCRHGKCEDGEVAHERVIDEAVVWSSVLGKRPDPSMLGSNAQTRNGRVLTSCTEELSASFGRIDVYQGERAFYEKSTCEGQPI
jgi:hypothetical protein